MIAQGRSLSPRRSGAGAVGFCLLVAGMLTAPLPALAEIRVGVAAPLTGRMAPVGSAIERALSEAVAEANAEGGILGQRVVLEVADDGCSTATAEGAAGHLIAHAPALVIGHPCSNAAASAAPLYGKAGVLLIAVGARHPDVTRGNGVAPVPVLRLAGRDDRQDEAAAAWLLANAPGRRVAIVHDRTQYARMLARDTAATLERAGVSPLTLPIVAGKPDYDETARTLRDSTAEAIFFAGYPDEAVVLANGLARLGFTPPLLGSDSLTTEAFAATAGTIKSRIEALMPMRASGRSANGLDAPERAGTEARGAFEAWIEGARLTQSTDPLAISRALCDRSLTTRALGSIRFDANGDLRTSSFGAAVPRGGRWVFEDQ